MKLVALDVGEKRVGVATADSTVRIAVPHSTIEVDGDEFAKIAKIMHLEDAKHLIVGLPRNAQGEETAQSRAVRAFAGSLQGYFVEHKLQRPLVKFQDESLTSVTAKERLSRKSSKRGKQRHSKADVDREAATIILQDFLDSFGGNTQPRETPAASTKKKPKAGKRMLKIFAVLLGLLLAAVAGAAIWYVVMTRPVTNQEICDHQNIQHDPAQDKCVNLDFIIAEGESTNTIANRLESEGIIRSALAFKIYLRLNHSGTIIRAGTYQLNSSMSMSDIAGQFQKGSSAETFSITFLPGGTVPDAKKRLADVGFSAEEIETAFAAEYEHPVLEGKPANDTLEGYIFGETYEFYATATVAEVLVRTFDELYKTVQENDLIAKYAERNLNLYQGITLASVVQRESHAPDMPQVAQVFLLRLQRNIPLGSCAVNEYRADWLGIERNSAIHENVNVLGCPWSSRHCPGLPPTPISSPGKAALMSVAEPAGGNYLYFLTDDDGNMRYAYTEAEHQANIRNYCKIRCYY